VFLLHTYKGKNTADLKIKSVINKFLQYSKNPSKLVLISGDADFIPDIRKAREQKVRTVLIHPLLGSKKLKRYAHCTICLE
ncbi:unnamed protein product, partial [Larinioides sclopetarius]